MTTRNTAAKSRTAGKSPTTASRGTPWERDNPKAGGQHKHLGPQAKAAAKRRAKAAGRTYPNLIDNKWLWGGSLAQIEQTITHGVRAGDDAGHQGAMPAFGRDNLLKPDEISAVADYVRSRAGLKTDPGADLTRGAKIFADNCAACHGPDGKGNRELGAPNLTDNIWLYAPDKKTIMDGVINGRGGVMPAWGGKLDDATLKALTVYVHTFGGGEQ